MHVSLLLGGGEPHVFSDLLLVHLGAVSEAEGQQAGPEAYTPL